MKYRPSVQRLSVLEQLFRQARSQPVGAGAGIALQQQHAVDDLAGGVALGRAEGAVVQSQLRQGLAAGECVVRDREIALLVVGPVGVFGLGERGVRRCRRWQRQRRREATWRRLL